MVCWYALQVRSNFEAVVERKLHEESIEGFFPSYQSKGWRNQLVRRPFFPGYVFSHFDPEQVRPDHLIPQVVRIVGTQSRPIPLTDEEAESVRVVTSAPVQAEPGPLFSAGELVMVESGPLRGVEGQVVFVPEKGARIIVFVKLLNRSVSAEVDVQCLRGLPIAA